MHSFNISEYHNITSIQFSILGALFSHPVRPVSTLISVLLCIGVVTNTTHAFRQALFVLCGLSAICVEKDRAGRGHTVSRCDHRRLISGYYVEYMLLELDEFNNQMMHVRSHLQ